VFPEAPEYALPAPPPDPPVRAVPGAQNFPPPPPPADVIVEKIESDPEVPAPGVPVGAPVPPPPTVIGVDPSANVIFVPPGKEVR
jgi:hypothetical protein